MTPEPREIRIPLFARAETPGIAGLGSLYAYNISRGGAYLKAPGAAPEAVALGRRFDLKLTLPDEGPSVTVGAEVVWVDPRLHLHAGERALGMGVRFGEVDDEVVSRIGNLVESFRYRVVAYGFDELAFAEAAFGDLYPVQAVSSLEALHLTSRSGQTGLIMMGERRGEQTTLAALEELAAATVDRRPPILYCAESTGPALEALLDEHTQVQFARLPMERAELRSQVRCAVDAFVVSFQTELLSDELARSLERLHRENVYLRARVDAPVAIEGIVGRSPAMLRAFELVERVAPLSTTVLVQGETGTGKELIVRAIVARSDRKDKPFIVQNCAAFSESLLENELFGHARGAYTGADRDRAGLFEAADGGTIFLDEVGEMPPSMQPKLLRVLENQEVRRLGETKTRRVDVRLLCATHRDLDQLVRDGTFRSDLLYRLRTFVIALPPLRERREDVPPLADHFLAGLSARHARSTRGLSHEAKRLLQANDWPGNARELAHTMERLFVLAGEGEIDAALVREVLGLPVAEGPIAARSLASILEDQERELIRVELERSNGVIAQAARALGLDRTTLTRRLRQLGLRGGPGPKGGGPP